MLQGTDEDDEIESEDQAGQGDNEGTGEEDTGNDKRSPAYSWFSLIDTAAETTHEPWSVVWEMGIYEFFNIIGFAFERAERRKKEMMKWKNKRTY